MKNKKITNKKDSSFITRSSAAEYLTFIAASGGEVEAIYSEEDVWLTQKMMAVLYDVETNTINYHLKKIFSNSELKENSVIRNFGITANLQDAGKVTAEIAKAHAESEFEKYRIIQDRIFESDFDREVRKLLEGRSKKVEGKDE